ncbi:xylulokinase [Planctopirus hydrillae]|uniref:Xylulose kinase n=1 Tax=Planctopirus hydrillae TaxID=1841610 RepID=A0A1C3ETS9_9PLAN|nr:xylulokinase [Planctopirus hydrillae]ODA36747.1 xylulokinase [Planctopirus hydrillae]
MGAFLGIDIGTSGTKTIVMRADGEILGSATVEYPLSSPKPGWSEQDPEDWWNAVVESTKKAIKSAKIKADEISGIGLSGQMHGSVFLDKSSEVLRPAILWNDQRTAAECLDIEKKAGGREKLIEMVANPALTGFTAPKIMWVKKNEPKIFDKTAQILLPKDYIRFRLTGTYATEVSDASGTLLLDVSQRVWCKPLLDKLDIPLSLLPKMHESEEVTGTVSAIAAKQLGLKAGIAVVGGAGDQAAGAVGNGIVKRGVISATMGTSGVVFAHSDEMQLDPQGRVHTFCHAVKGKWHVMGCVLSAGGSLQWYRNTLGLVEVADARRLKTDPYNLITEQAAEAPAGCEGLFFLPYLTGERTPHADPLARGAWVGLTIRHGRAHLIRAVMEGATYAMRDCLEIINELKIPIREIRVSGGGARSQFWRQMQADVYGRRVVTINAEEGPAYGVALLAAAGTGEYKSVVEACTATIRVNGATDPNSEAKRVYNKSYPMFGKLYRSLKPDFPELAKLVDV